MFNLYRRQWEAACKQHFAIAQSQSPYALPYKQHNSDQKQSEQSSTLMIFISASGSDKHIGIIFQFWQEVISLVTSERVAL